MFRSSQNPFNGLVNHKVTGCP